jgi:hypothetical protein
MTHSETLLLALQAIGFSHIVQPPLTGYLKKRLHLGDAFGALDPLPRVIAENMGLCSVAMPTTLGLWLCGFAAHAMSIGPVWVIALLLGLFWSWRLYRQIWVLGPRWPASVRWLSHLLTSIFVVQGPGLLLTVAAVALATR